MIALCPYHVIHQEYGSGKVIWYGCFATNELAQRFVATRLEKGDTGSFVVAQVTHTTHIEPSFRKETA